LASQNFSSVSNLYLPIAERPAEFRKQRLNNDYRGCLVSAYDRTSCQSIQDIANASSLASSHTQESLSSFMERERTRGSVILLTVANPWDMRKNLISQIKSISDFSFKGRRVALIVKSTLLGLEPWNLIASLLVNKHGIKEICVSNSIWVSSDYFEKDDLDALYQLVDAYICTSSCEGLNLPLIEAIRNMCPIITPLHSAMSGYLDSQACFSIPYDTSLARNDSSCLGGAYKLYWQECKVKDIQASIIEFMQASSAIKAQKVRHAFTQVSSKYNQELFSSSISKFINL